MIPEFTRMTCHVGQHTKGARPMTTDLTASIKAAEQMRCRAMLANDTAALEALLDPRLHFSHATGAVDNRKSYMAKIAAGRIQYTAIQWDEEQVLALADNAALLTGRMTSDVIVEGATKRLHNRVIMAWSHNDGAWQLAAFQSTPMAV